MEDTYNIVWATVLEACGVAHPGSPEIVIMQDRLVENWLTESPGFNSGMSMCLLSFFLLVHNVVCLNCCPCLVTAGID